MPRTPPTPLAELAFGEFEVSYTTHSSDSSTFATHNAVPLVTPFVYVPSAWEANRQELYRLLGYLNLFGSAQSHMDDEHDVVPCNPLLFLPSESTFLPRLPGMRFSPEQIDIVRRILHTVCASEAKKRETDIAMKRMVAAEQEGHSLAKADNAANEATDATTKKDTLQAKSEKGAATHASLATDDLETGRADAEAPAKEADTANTAEDAAMRDANADANAAMQAADSTKALQELVHLLSPRQDTPKESASNIIQMLSDLVRPSSKAPGYNRRLQYLNSLCRIIKERCSKSHVLCVFPDPTPGDPLRDAMLATMKSPEDTTDCISLGLFLRADIDALNAAAKVSWDKLSKTLPGKPISIHTPIPYDHSDGSATNGAYIGRVTHALVFDDEKDREGFFSFIRKLNPAIVAMGGTTAHLKTICNSIEKHNGVCIISGFGGVCDHIRDTLDVHSIPERNLDIIDMSSTGEDDESLVAASDEDYDDIRASSCCSRRKKKSVSRHENNGGDANENRNGRTELRHEPVYEATHPTAVSPPIHARRLSVAGMRSNTGSESGRLPPAEGNYERVRYRCNTFFENAEHKTEVRIPTGHDLAQWPAPPKHTDHRYHDLYMRIHNADEEDIIAWLVQMMENAHKTLDTQDDCNGFIGLRKCLGHGTSNRSVRDRIYKKALNDSIVHRTIEFMCFLAWAKSDFYVERVAVDSMVHGFVHHELKSATMFASVHDSSLGTNSSRSKGSKDRAFKHFEEGLKKITDVGGLKQRRETLNDAYQTADAMSAYAWKYRVYAFLIQFLLRGALLATTALSIEQGRRVIRYDRDGTAEQQLKIAIIAMSSILVVGNVVNGAVRPVSRFAIASTAANRIKSEIFRFRCEVSPYVAVSHRRRRQIFTKRFLNIQKSLERGNVQIPNNRSQPWGCWSCRGSCSACTSRNTDIEANRNDSDGTTTSVRYSYDFLDASTYIKERALPALRDHSKAASWGISAYFVSVVIVATLAVASGTFGTSERLTLWAPLVAAVISFVEFVAGFLQLERYAQSGRHPESVISQQISAFNGPHIPGKEGAMAAKDRLVNTIEDAILGAHSEYVEDALESFSASATAEATEPQSNDRRTGGGRTRAVSVAGGHVDDSPR